MQEGASDPKDLKNKTGSICYNRRLPTQTKPTWPIRKPACKSGALFWIRGVFSRKPILGNANLFKKVLFTIFAPLNRPSPNQQSDGFPLEFLWKGPQRELRTLSQTCEQTLQKKWTNRIMNKRAFLKFYFKTKKNLCAKIADLSGTTDSFSEPLTSGDLLKPLNYCCDPGRHLQECPGAKAGKCPKVCFLECLWAPGSECHKERTKECFLGSQHPSPNVKTFCKLEPQIWLEKLSHHVMPKVLVLKVRGRHVER